MGAATFGQADMVSLSHWERGLFLLESGSLFGGPRRGMLTSPVSGTEKVLSVAGLRTGLGTGGVNIRGMVTRCEQVVDSLAELNKRAKGACCS